MIEIGDSALYAAPPALDMTGDRLVIQATNGQRPCIVGNLTITGGSDQAQLVLNGMLIGGDLLLQGRLTALEITHCTLVRRQGQSESHLEVAGPNERLDLVLDHAVTGALRVPGTIAHLVVRDSILDAAWAVAGSDDGKQPGPASTFERATVLGNVHVIELTLASESIFDRGLRVDRHQSGCVRYSFVPDGMRVPRGVTAASPTWHWPAGRRSWVAT